MDINVLNFLTNGKMAIRSGSTGRNSAASHDTQSFLRRKTGRFRDGYHKGRESEVNQHM
jgi:hypothetical protein